MRRLALLGAAAALTTMFAAPVVAQEATQEPGTIGFNYPNSRYLTGGYGVRTPYNTGRYPHMYPAPRVIAYGGPVDVAVGPVGVAVVPYEPYAYDPY